MSVTAEERRVDTRAWRRKEKHRTPGRQLGRPRMRASSRSREYLRRSRESDPRHVPHKQRNRADTRPAGYGAERRGAGGHDVHEPTRRKLGACTAVQMPHQHVLCRPTCALGRFRRNKRGT